MSTTNFDQLLADNNTEFYQLALIVLARKAGGTLAINRADLMEAYKYMAEADQFKDKIVIKTVVKPADFDLDKSAQYFQNAKKGTWPTQPAQVTP